MSEIKRVKIDSILESQLPEYMLEESPLFVEFLRQYYKSLEHQSGTLDLASNFIKYKNVQKFNNTDLIADTTTTEEVFAFDDEISVESTEGWPDTYGLLKIDDEIITYTSKTSTSFLGCARGFSGIDQIESLDNSSFLNFSESSADSHSSGAKVLNLSNLFLQKFFENFKFEFFPGFENRSFYENASVENIILNARNFYRSKGTDVSYKFLFGVLYGVDVDIIKPSDYTLSSSSDEYFVTKNLLVEKISGANPLDITGNFLFQNTGLTTTSGSIFNSEIRPVLGKNLYEISLDSSSISGTFKVTGQTKILEDIEIDDDNILVDSTVGFPQAGSLLVKPENSDFIQINYGDKTTNQFLDVTGVTKKLNSSLSLVENNFAFSYVGFGNTSKVEFRIINVIDDVNLDGVSNLRKGDKIRVSSFGKNLSNNVKFNNWIYNLPITHNVESIEQVSSNKFRLILFDKIIPYVEDRIIVYDRFDGLSEAEIIEVTYDQGDATKKYSNIILVQLLNTASIDTSAISFIKRKVYRANHYSNYYPNLNKFVSGIQNTYIDKNNEYFYVTSSGLPNYTMYVTDDKRVVETIEEPFRPVNLIGFTSIFSCPNHNYQNGISVYYDTVDFSTSGVSTGFYYVTVVDNDNIKLSFSSPDVFSQRYIEAKAGISSDTIVFSGYENKSVTHQKLLRKFPIDLEQDIFDDFNERTTFNRSIGLLANGVELLSPSYFDENIFYGEIKSIDVTDSGSGYDVVTPPTIEVKDLLGSGCKAHVNLSGSVEGVEIIVPGVGYSKKPKITIFGGNGQGCSLESNLVRTRIESTFKGDNNVDQFSDYIDLLAPTAFVDGEEVLYDANINVNVPGIIDGSSYFVGIISDTRIKLYNTKEDALNKTNEIDIVGVSSGFHVFRTVELKNTINQIYVREPGEGYSNRKVKVPSILSHGNNNKLGINTFDSYIFAKNHGFNDSELVTYSNTDTPIVGLDTNNYYHVKVLDTNRFKLSFAGTSQFTLSDEDYLKRKFVKFDSIGVGTHIIGYPPISISVEATSSIGSSSIVVPVLKPIVLGQIDDVYVEDGGVSYGCTDILNFHRRPSAGVSSVRSIAFMDPIVVNGRIVDVKILNSGLGYRPDSDIIVTGDGDFAQLQPIIDEFGRLDDVTVIDGGFGYDADTTQLTLENRGVGAKFLANVHSWKIDQVVKLQDYINPEDDGILLNSKNEDLELQFCNYYIPKKLRYQLNDNFTNQNKETEDQLSHSPIVGYAYDGNPIYGPYGYDTPSGGAIRNMVSSYVLDFESNNLLRPPGFTPGYFINDYSYTSSGDLDQFNGRFCVTPEFPDGTYAYFYSIEVDISKIAKNKYPYVIGPSFRNRPVNQNFLPLYNQDFDQFDNSITRNIGPYYFNNINSSYEVLDSVSEDFRQEFEITELNTGRIENVSVFFPGDNYKVNDKVRLDNEGTDGSGASIVVSKLKGRSIDAISFNEKNISDVVVLPKGNEILLDFVEPHELLNNEPVAVTGVSTISANSIEGIHRISVNDKSCSLVEDIPTDVVSGVSTFIKVNEVDGFRSGDYIGIGTEVMFITQVSTRRSGFFVNRLTNTGIHTAGIEDVNLLPRQFTFKVKEPLDDLIIPNRTLYFNPIESVGIGVSGITRLVVGVGTNSEFEDRFLPSKSIYLPSHNLYTGQPIRYSSGFAGTSLYVNNVGSGVSFALLDDQVVYAVNISQDYLGISTIGYTSSIGGIGTNLTSVEFWDLGTGFNIVGSAHSFTTLFNEITCSVNRVSGVVTTASDHNLSVGDQIDLTISSKLTEEYKVFFDVINRKILINDYIFTNSDVDLEKNIIQNDQFKSFKSGTKVIYTATSPLGGLNSSQSYFILKKDVDKISLCEYASDVLESKEIDLTSFSVSGTQSFRLINPPLNPFFGSLIVFDVSDVSLLDLRLDFYKNANFTNLIELIGVVDEGFAITREGIPGTSGAKVTLDTTKKSFPEVFYYNLTPISPSDETKNQLSSDIEIDSYNKINILNHKLSGKVTIDLVSDTDTFAFNSEKLLTPTELEILENPEITYITNSKTAKGPIEDLRVNFGGLGYRIVPVITDIVSDEGRNAVLKLISDNIGEVETIERVKDGFDYPTDPTLSAQLSSTIVCGIKDINTIDYINILNGGSGYNDAPTLLVRGGEGLGEKGGDIQLKAVFDGGSITNVDIVENSTALAGPLDIIPIYNSNGLEIDAFTINGFEITIELFNSPTAYPLINTGYGSSITTFPFAPGDEIFIEKVSLTDETNTLQNYNSENFDYKFFTVTGISTLNNTLTYSVAGLTTAGFNGFGDYNDERRGVVINKSKIASFEMILKDDVKYSSSEKVTTKNFSGRIMENGWDNRLNQMRITDIEGNLEIGDVLVGSDSKVKGIVEYINSFEFDTSFSATRDKVNINKNNGVLNDSQLRISDNYYYQKFSYLLRSTIPYSTWRESVRSIVHPSGFQEFSDYVLLTEPTIPEVNLGIAKSTSMTPVLNDGDSSLLFNIDSVQDFASRKNYALVYEDNLYPDGSTDQIYFEGDGVSLKPYILNKTNKVLTLDDISPQFNGTTQFNFVGRYADASNLLILNRDFIQEEVVSFVEFNYPNIGLSTTYSREKCLRDTGFIVDAVSHDLKYASNNKSVEAGLAYWDAGASYVVNETEETLFAYNYVKFLGQYVINNQTPPTLYQTTIKQKFDFALIEDPLNYDFSRFKDARNLIVGNRREIQDTALASVAIAHSDFYFPGDAQTNEFSRYYDGYRLIQQNKQEIIDYAYNNALILYAGISTAQDQYELDLNNFINGISLDVFTGGNNYTRKFSGTFFENDNIQIGNVTQLIYAFNQARVGMQSAVANQLTIQDLTVTGDPNPGSDPPPYGTPGVTANNTDPDSCSDVQDAILTLTTVVTSALGSGTTSFFPAENVGTYTTGGNKCFRDLGYIIDGVAQDIAYGTNQHTVYNTKKYFDGVGVALTDGLLGEEAESITAFVAARDAMKLAVTNNLYYQDLTISADPLTGINTDPNSCADVRAEIDVLVGILTVAIGNSSLSTVPEENYGTTDCANVRQSLGNYIGIITTIIGFGTDFAPEKYEPLTSLGDQIVGLTSFKLTNKGTSVFQHIFDAGNDQVINLDTNVITIFNHNYQTGQELTYDSFGNNPIGIATTSYVSAGIATILMEVGNINGSAVLENGYSVSISTTITGISTVLVPAGPTFKQFLGALSTSSGLGTDAQFTVSVSYDNITGQPLSTSIQPTFGGRGYAIGDTVSIAGTYLGGTSPTNDLSFVVSTTGASGIQTEANAVYTNVPSDDSNGAIFNVTRDSAGYISQVDVVYGGVGYNTTSTNIGIAGTYLAGDDLDSITVDAKLVGSDKLGGNVFVYKLNDNQFGLLGISTSPNFLTLTSLGIGSQSLSLVNPNESTLISIDGIPQPALAKAPIVLSTEPTINIGLTTTVLQITAGISSVRFNDVIKLDDELMIIRNILVKNESVFVERGAFGSQVDTHLGGSFGDVFRGNMNIVGDTVWFSDPPYGLFGPPGIQTSSTFSGRVFSRQLDAQVPEDRNLIFDDISNDFTGVASTEFLIKVNGNTTTTIFNDVNFGTNINNIPLVFINGVFQNPINDVTVDNDSTNTLRFLSGTPSAGKISQVSISTTFGYQPILPAYAVATVSIGGTIESITVTDGGSGYRGTPDVYLSTNVGSGVSLQAVVSTSGTTAGQITDILVINPGAGYTTTDVPDVVIGIDTGYANLNTEYVGTPGDGQGAKVTVKIGMGSSVIEFKIDDPGVGYKVDDQIKVVGIPTVNLRNDNLEILTTEYYNVSGIATITTLTDHLLGIGDDVRILGSTFGFDFDSKVIGIPTVGSGTTNEFQIDAGISTVISSFTGSGGIVSFRQVEEFILTVDRIETDDFSAFYPGQFIVFNDISSAFNGFRTKFTLSQEINGQDQIVNLKTLEGSDMDITNNIFIWINDVLQDPTYAYSFRGSRVIFTEPPIPDSKCVILYYRGSSIDVEEIVPPPSIKEGDVVTIQESSLDIFDIEQFPRTVKTIVSSDQIDTFVYNSIGINSDTNSIRPITWQKQKTDKIISGTLFSKSRPGLKSRVVPNATIIKDIDPGDTVIYVDNAFPLFEDLDELTENLRDIIVTENQKVESATAYAVVSASSTVSSIVLTDGGVGYGNTLLPKVIVSSSAIKLKDPVYQWQTSVIDDSIFAIDSNSQFNSISYGNQLVSVGNSSLYSYSYDSTNWVTGDVGVGSTINLLDVNRISIGSSDIILAVGNEATIAQSVGFSNTLTSWIEIDSFEEETAPGVGIIGYNPTTYNGTFTSIAVGLNKWVVVGTAGSIFESDSVYPERFISRVSNTLSDLNSIVFAENIFVAVGDNGTVINSNNGNIWDTITSGVPLINFNKIIHDGNDFIIVGNGGIILRSTTQVSYEQIANTIPASENILNIEYFENVYFANTSAGKFYYSLDLVNWVYRDLSQFDEFSDYIFVNDYDPNGKFIVVGAAGTIISSVPVYHRAEAVGTVTNGEVTSIQVTDGGFGYVDSDVPNVLIESDTFKVETINSFKVIGDYGNLIGVTTFLPGSPGIGTTSPKLEFTLQSESYDNSTLGVGYSAPNTFGVINSLLDIGDYFIISDSNVETDGSLVSISTYLGGMANYPNSVIGISTNYLDGVYRVDFITQPYAGIVTVTCHFAPDANGGVNAAVRGEYDGSSFSGINTNGFYGKYSWSKIYDYQNRSLSISGGKAFETYTDNGLTGLSTSAKVMRTRSVVSD